MKNIIQHKYLKLICFGIFLSLFWSCKTTKIEKEKTKENDLAILENLFIQNDYHIEIDVAYPFNTASTAQVSNVLFRNTINSANRIDVRGDSEYIKIKNDSVKGYLSFYGERRINSGDYGGRNVAIQFDGPLMDLEKEINKDKGKVELEFTADQSGNDSENYTVKIEIFPNKEAVVNITPTYKTFMRYDGRLVDDHSKD
jgi:hypothetical protein